MENSNIVENRAMSLDKIHSQFNASAGMCCNYIIKLCTRSKNKYMFGCKYMKNTSVECHGIEVIKL